MSATFLSNVCKRLFYFSTFLTFLYFLSERLLHLLWYRYVHGECTTGGLGMMWFIIWMLLIADEPLRDGGMSDEEKHYINACLTSQPHQQQQPLNVQQQVTYTHSL